MLRHAGHPVLSLDGVWVTCYYPVKAYRSQERNPETGRYGITFNPHKALVEGAPFHVPCGRCIGCRVDRAQAWGVRCHHEAQMHSKNCFITLTYDEENVPQDYSVKLPHFQKFMKRLRKKYPQKIRFLASGEYGDQLLRPHYHAIIFNHDFSDKKQITIRNNFPVYVSEQLKSLWPLGSHEIGNVTFKSSCYVARYCMKKVGGDKADDHYYRESPVDGQHYRVEPEFCVQSKGLGQTWFDKFKSDAFPSDFLVIDGKKVKPPRFYLNQLKEDKRDRLMAEHEEKHEIQTARKAHARLHRSDNTKERLAVREKVHAEKLKRLKRTL